MNNLNKIAFIIPSLQAGGMERVMSELLFYFEKKENTECHLILYGSTRDVFYKIPIEVAVHKPSFIFNNKYRIIHTVRTIFSVRSMVKDIHPDVILSFGEYWNNLVLLSTYKLKVPVYISERSSPNISLGKMQESLRRNLYPKAKGIIAQTTTAKTIYEKRNYNKNISVIGNPIRSIEHNNNFVRENIIVSVGRLIDTKHFDRLIEIFASINNPEWKLIIVGGDSNKQNNSQLLTEHVKKLGLENNIILAGNQRNVENYLLNASIFAFTSSSEGFPNVIGEAMSAGLPVVSYDCVAGPSDMIEDGKNGYLIPLFDDDLFRNRLEELMNNIDKRQKMALNALMSIKQFSVERIGEQYYNFIMRRK